MYPAIVVLLKIEHRVVHQRDGAALKAREVNDHLVAGADLDLNNNKIK